jgi:adenylate cyclase
VLGQTFKYEILVRVADQPEPSVVAALATCIDHQLVVEADGSPRRYQFRHALTREAIYGELIGPERDRLHLRAAEVLGKDPSTAPADLAHHLVAAQKWDEAVPVCLKAAEEALRTSAFGDAAELYARALPHIDDAVQRARVLCRLGYAQYYSTALASRALPYLEEGIESLEQMGHARDAAGYRLMLGRCYWEEAQPERARVQYELVRSRLKAEGPSGDLAMAYVRLAAMHEYQAEAGSAIRLAQRAIEVARRASADEPRIEAEMYMAMATSGREASAQLLHAYRKALELGLDEIALRSLGNANLKDMLEYRARDVPGRRHLFEPLRTGGFEKVTPLMESGQLAWLMGDVPEALDRLEEARSHPLLQGTFRRWMEIWLVAVYAELGRFEDSRRMIPRQEGLERQDAWQLAIMAIPGRLAAGDLELAVDEAIDLWKRKDEGDPSTEKSWLFDAAVEALIAGDKLAPARDLVVKGRLNPGVDGHNPHQDRAEGRLALAEGRLSDAIGSLRAAADFFAAAGYRLEEARNRRTLAEALIRSGDAAGGETELRAVIRYADDCGAVVQGRLAREALARIGAAVEPAPSVERPAFQDQAPAVAGERMVTVLFVDVRGYTEISSRDSPAALSERMAALYRWSRREVERHHGVINHYAGDAIMATFNVAGTRVDHATQAFEAALAIIDKAAMMDLPAGAGIAVGPAVVGKLSQDSPATAIGETVNLAARLQAQAGAGEVLLTEEAYRRVRELLAESGSPAKNEHLELKGFPGQVSAYRVMGHAGTSGAPASGRRSSHR